MEYITTKEASLKWGISPTRITILANEGRIPGAQRLGKSWLIPADAAKPAKLKARHAHIAEEETDNFSFPLYYFRPDWSSAKESLLSDQQKALLSAERAVQECRFADAFPLLETIASAPADIGTEIGTLWNIGICCIALNNPETFARVFLRLQFLLSEDFPHRDDLAIILDALKTYVETVGTAASCTAYNTDIHEQCLPLMCMLLGYAHLTREAMRHGAADAALLEINLRLLQNTSAVFAVGMMHDYLLDIYSMRGNLPEAQKHAGAIVQLAFEKKLYFPLVTFYRYAAPVLSPVLAQYPDDFQEHCRELIAQYEKSFTDFFSSLDQYAVIAKLTDSDYPYAWGVLQDLPYTRMAEKLGVARLTVKRRVDKLCAKLGVKNKKELRQYLRSNI